MTVRRWLEKLSRLKKLMSRFQENTRNCGLISTWSILAILSLPKSQGTVRLVLCKFRAKKWNEVITGPCLVRRKWKKSVAYGKAADGVRSVVTVSKSLLEWLLHRQWKQIWERTVAWKLMADLSACLQMPKKSKFCCLLFLKTVGNLFRISVSSELKDCIYALLACIRQFIRLNRKIIFGNRVIIFYCSYHLSKVKHIKETHYKET